VAVVTGAALVAAGSARAATAVAALVAVGWAVAAAKVVALAAKVVTWAELGSTHTWCRTGMNTLRCSRTPLGS